MLRAGGIAEIAPLGDMAAVPAILRWQPVAGSAQYRIRLLDVEQAEVWTAMAVSTAELPIPAAAQALMPPRETLFWAKVSKWTGRPTVPCRQAARNRPHHQLLRRR